MELSEELISKIESCTDVTEVVAVLNGAGYDFTAEDVEAALAEFNGELDENALDDVAGGLSVPVTTGARLGVAVLKYVIKNARKFMII